MPSRDRDRARAHQRDQVERGAERADDAAERVDAIDRAGDASGMRRIAQQQADAERRIHAEKGHREEQDCDRCDQAAGPHIVDAGQQRLQHPLGENRDQQDVDRTDNHGQAQDRQGRGAVGEPAAQEITDAQGRQHGRDQRRPGVDAAAEIRIEVARAQHLETHDDGAHHEGRHIDDDRDGGRSLIRPIGHKSLPAFISTPAAGLSAIPTTRHKLLVLLDYWPWRMNGMCTEAPFIWRAVRPISGSGFWGFRMTERRSLRTLLVTLRTDRPRIGARRTGPGTRTCRVRWPR